MPTGDDTADVLFAAIPDEEPDARPEPTPDDFADAFASIPDAVAAIARGEIIIVVDDPDRENEGDFLMAADAVTPEAVNFMITHGRGLLCTPITEQRAEDLGLRRMASPGGPRDTAFTISVDLAASGGTGISAADRAECITKLMDPDARASDFSAPGHIFPIRARDGGVLVRAGHTEAACDLARMAGFRPGGVICEITNDDGTMARLPDLVEIAERHGLLLITIADLIDYRRRHEAIVRRTAQADIPTPHGVFAAVCFEDVIERVEHVAFVRSDVAGREQVPVSVHGECLLGDILAGASCDCGIRLRQAMRRVAATGEGVVVYLRRPDRAPAAVEKGLGWPCAAQSDLDEAVVEQILDGLGVRSTRAVTEPAPERMPSAGDAVIA